MQRRTLLLSGAALVAAGGYATWRSLAGGAPDLASSLILPGAAQA